jgi:hypothetical protein
METKSGLVGQKTRINDRMDMESDHPYMKYQLFPEWEIVDQAISDLVNNNDLIEQTARPYITGHIIKSLEKRGLLTKSSN